MPDTFTHQHDPGTPAELVDGTAAPERPARVTSRPSKKAAAAASPAESPATDSGATTPPEG